MSKTPHPGSPDLGTRVRRQCLATLAAWGAVVAVALTGFDARADATDFELLDPNPAADGGLMLESPRLITEAMTFGGYLHAERYPLVFSRRGGSTSPDRLVSHRLQLRAIASFNLYDYVQVGLDLPIMLASGVKLNDDRVNVTTLNDPILRLKAPIVSVGGETKLHLGVSGSLQMALGDAENFAGSDGRFFQPALKLLGEVERKRWYSRLTLGWREREQTFLPGYDVELNDLWLFRGGFGFETVAGRTWFFEYVASTAVGDAFSNVVHDASEFVVGWQIPVRDFVLTPASAFGLSKAFGVPSWRLLLSFFWKSPPPAIPARLDVHVQDARGQPLPEAQVAVAGERSREGKTGPDGRVGFRRLRPGDVTVTGTLEDYKSAEAGTTLKSGERTSLTLAMDAGYARSLLRLRTKDADTGGPVTAEVGVQVTYGKRGETFSLSTARDGVTEASVLPGRARIQARAAGYEALSREIDVSGAGPFDVELAMAPVVVAVSEPVSAPVAISAPPPVSLPALTLGDLVAKPGRLRPGQTFTLRANVAGYAGALTVAADCDGDGRADMLRRMPPDAWPLRCPMALPLGDHRVSLAVTDAVGRSVAATTDVAVVNATPRLAHVPGLDPKPVMVGTPFAVTLAVVDDDATLTYALDCNGDGVAELKRQAPPGSLSLACPAPALPGPTPVTVFVVDPYGAFALGATSQVAIEIVATPVTPADTLRPFTDVTRAGGVPALNEVRVARVEAPAREDTAQASGRQKFAKYDWDGPVGTLNVSIVDETTGRPPFMATAAFNAGAKAGGVLRKTINASGALEVELPPGKISITLVAPGYFPAVQEIDVTEGASSTLQLVLRPLSLEAESVALEDDVPGREEVARVAVQVLDYATGKPVRRGQVYLLRGERDFALADGVAELEFAAGRARFGVQAPGYHPRTFDLEVTRSGDYETKLALAPVQTGYRIAGFGDFAWPLRADWFVPGGATLSDEGRAYVAALAAYLAAHTDDPRLTIDVHVIGGSGAADFGLATGRARAIEAALVAAGVDKARFRTVGHDVARPLLPAEAAGSADINTRIEFSFVETTADLAVEPEAPPLDADAVEALPALPVDAAEDLLKDLEGQIESEFFQDEAPEAAPADPDAADIFAPDVVAPE